MKEQNTTQKYYEENSQAYIEQTMATDMSTQYALFEKYLSDDACILDVGFGSGRDMLYFTSKGYSVFGIDVISKFVEHAQKLGLNVQLADFHSLPFICEFDAAWACASLLHSTDLNCALLNVVKAVKPNGIIYLSMKVGLGTDMVGQRFYRYVDEIEISQLAKQFNLQILEMSITADKLNRTNQWINVIYKKQG